MSAFTITGVLGISGLGVGASKRVILSATGPTSYDAGGSVLNVSSGNATLTALRNGPDAAFTKVHGVRQIGVSPAASDRYHSTYVRAAEGAPATGVVKLRDMNTDDSAEPSGDLSTTTVFLEIVGQ